MAPKPKEYIPFQKCPVCEGDGKNTIQTFFGTEQMDCHCCGGSGAIPMCEKK